MGLVVAESVRCGAMYAVQCVRSLTPTLTTTLTNHAPVEFLGPNMATNSSSGSFQNVTSDRNPTPDMGATTARLWAPSDTLTSAVPER